VGLQSLKIFCYNDISRSVFDAYTRERIIPGKKRYKTYYIRDSRGLFYNPVIEEVYNGKE